VPDILYFSLLFVTLVVLAAILWSRLGRYEAYLRDLQGIQTLNERLRDLVDGLEGLKTRRVEEQLRGVQDLLEQIRNGIQRSLDRPAVVQELVAAPSGQPELTIHDLVEAKLFNLGYREVVIVNDLDVAEPGEPIRVVVEARKDGAIHKGHLVLKGRSVTEVDLQPVFNSFP